MVGTRKDGESPLRSKKIVDAPQSRVLGIAHSGRLHRRSRGICGGGCEPKNLSHFDMTINDVILGSIYHSIQYFLHPRFQQIGTKRLHVGKSLV